MFDLYGPPRAQLARLLKEYNEYPERQDEVKAEIYRQFTRKVALMNIDSCGFSRGVQQHGIVHSLALLERLGRVVVPLFEAHGGRLLRTDADNFFAVFPDTASAVRCAAEIQHNVRVANDPLPAAQELYVAIGIGYGDALLVGEDDVYGDEMNLACKLGEDLADRGEVLLTAAARQSLGDTQEWQFEDYPLRLSGLELPAFRLVL
ncbi:MAG: adenylate/guanylate cyclase domain-containing protein [Chloroflexi bacterium]|nr:adenylate/guanylate cyclase domain-containing protein [Chloroflexota bacterium]